MPIGTYRRVLLLGGLAIKMPRLWRLLSGLRCNRWEREMWYVWRPVFGWENLCPVTFADPLGLLLVMPRALQPVTFDDVVAATPDYYPDTTAEYKPENFGKVGSRVLALDYGLPDADLVRERRAYYVERSVWKQ
jgi:hypothetical protein